MVTINKRLKYYERNAKAYSIRQLNQKVILKNLGGAICSKYALQGGKALDDIDKIIDLIN